MKKILNIEIELSSKNIIVTSLNEDIGMTEKKGYSPLTYNDWESVDLLEEVRPYKVIAWKDYEKPLEILEENG